MSVGGLLGRALLGGTAAASEGIYSQYQEDMKQKRTAALENIRNNFATARDNTNYERQVERDNINYTRETERGDTTYARDRADKVADDQAARAHAIKLASMRTTKGDNKLNPYISAQVEGVDNQLKALYKAQSEGILDPDQQASIQQLQQMRTFLLGGGMPSAPVATATEVGDSGGGGSAPEQAAAPPQTATPEKPQGPGLLQRGMDWYTNMTDSGTQAPPTGDLAMKTDAMMKAIDRGEPIDPKLAREVYPYLAGSYRAKIDAPR